MSTADLYRLLLRAYPRDYRQHRGEELLATLLDTEDEPGGRRPGSRAGEAVALVLHGVSLRARLTVPAVRDRLPALGLAGVALGIVLGVLGLHQLLGAAVRATGLHGYPAEWHLYVHWVDPRWPVQATWLALGIALLAARPRPALALAWGAVLLHAWYLLAAAATGGQIPWIGNVGPFWTAPSGTAEVGWFVLSLSVPLLLGGTRRTTAALTELGSPALRRATALGAATALVGTAVGPLSRALSDDITTWQLHFYGPMHSIEGPVPALAATAAALAWALLRRDQGRAALLALVLLAAAPLGVRWADSMAAYAGAFLLFVAGYLAASLRSSRPDRRT